MYTVKQLSELADITVRTLHHYDEIDLLKPSKVGANGYRYYDDDALLRLQQILFYREIGLELMQIKDILDSPDFDLLSALRSHRAAIQEKTKRLHSLISTIDNTIQHLEGEHKMSDKGLFKGFSEEQQKEYEREARLRWGPTNVNESVKRWKSYTKAQQDAVMAEAGQIYADWVKAMEADLPADSDEVRRIVERWHNNLRNFYEPTLDLLRGLGELYNTDPAFMATFHKFHPDLPPYLQATITQYVDDLETAEITRMLAEDEVSRLNGS
jgi:DNA-binding transcriptional MerR regulator